MPLADCDARSLNARQGIQLAMCRILRGWRTAVVSWLGRAGARSVPFPQRFRELKPETPSASAEASSETVRSARVIPLTRH